MVQEEWIWGVADVAGGCRSYHNNLDYPENRNTYKVERVFGAFRLSLAVRKVQKVSIVVPAVEGRDMCFSGIVVTSHSHYCLVVAIILILSFALK